MQGLVASLSMLEERNLLLMFQYEGAAQVCGTYLMLSCLQGEKQEPNTDFKPNLVNTVCFLVQFIIQLITFAVNYQV